MIQHSGCQPTNHCVATTAKLFGTLSARGRGWECWSSSIFSTYLMNQTVHHSSIPRLVMPPCVSGPYKQVRVCIYATYAQKLHFFTSIPWLLITVHIVVHYCDYHCVRPQKSATLCSVLVACKLYKASLFEVERLPSFLSGRISASEV